MTGIIRPVSASGAHDRRGIDLVPAQAVRGERGKAWWSWRHLSPNEGIASQNTLPRFGALDEGVGALA